MRRQPESRRVDVEEKQSCGDATDFLKRRGRRKVEDECCGFKARGE